VQYSNKLAATIFKQEYLEEKLYSYIDNLNLLYVAFTRPKHRLIISAPKPKESKSKKSVEIKNVSDLLWQSVSTSFFDSATDNAKGHPQEEFDEETLMFVYGQAKPLLRPPTEASVVESSNTNWQSTPFRNRLKMRLSGIGYFSDDGTRDFGTLMHAIVSEIRTLSDLDSTLEKRVLSGELTTDEKQNLHQSLLHSLSLPEVKDWYSGNYHVLNEQQVLHPSMNFVRPDRVMIKDDEVVVVDYKFGESIESKYVKQVQRYTKSIRDMGYANVQGYLFYVKLQKVVKV
jgi:ATP-dependent exoDNAse (exonuclease V) beta subunit